MVDGTETTEGIETAEGNTSTEAGSPEVKVLPAREALVKQWMSRIRSAEGHYRKQWERIEMCMEIARLGSSKQWADADMYVVPVINRHINQAVAQLYAKNPKPVIERRRRRLTTDWDGTMQTLDAAMQQAVMGDPMSQKIVREAAGAQQYQRMMDGLGDTLEILYQYFMDEQASHYKQQLKAAVRRVKVCSAAFIKVGYQRVLEKRPETMMAIEDTTAKIAMVKQRLAEVGREQHDDDAPELEELYTNLRDLEAQEDLIVREGPVLDFPRTLSIIVDPACFHLKTFAGARWVAQKYELSAAEIEEIWGVDVRARTTIADDDIQSWWEKNQNGEDACEGTDKKNRIRVFEIYDKKLRQMSVVCEGWPDFLDGPRTPDVFVEQFFPLFPIVFNEIESEDELYPPSDVWLSKHPQDEYNRSRQGLREHRIAARPYYVTTEGMLEQKDKDALSSHAAHEIVELSSLAVGEDVARMLQRGPTAPIDPNLYEVEMVYSDMQRTIGSQEANLGGTSDATATEVSVAEGSRGAALADNVDDLDDVLTLVARALGQIMMLELDRATVEEIVGPGAVWPDDGQTRQEIAKELSLSIKAGSSGRPNRAAELANLERAMPYLLQMPGINPRAILEKYTDLLDIDVDDLVVDGLPSITALNSAMGRGPQAPQGGGNPQTDPAQQGARGAQNAPNPQERQAGPQPEYPAA